jgi:uncharacterized membrane protein YccF (DUF307 family)
MGWELNILTVGRKLLLVAFGAWLAAMHFFLAVATCEPVFACHRVQYTKLPFGVPCTSYARTSMWVPVGKGYVSNKYWIRSPADICNNCLDVVYHLMIEPATQLPMYKLISPTHFTLP